MRRRAFALILLGLSTLATAALCDFQSGYYAPTGQPSLTQKAAPNFSLDAYYAVSMYPIYPPVFQAGDGVTEVKTYCNTCHSPRYITMQPPLPAATWVAEVNKMVTAYGASIPDDSKQRIIRYLQTHFTPETRRTS